MSGGGCAWIGRDEIFEDYVRGAIGPEDRDAFEAHYFACEACFDRLHLYEALHTELGAAPAEAHAPQPVPAWPWRWVLAPLAGTIVLVLAAALWFKSPPLPMSPAVIEDARPAAGSVAAPAQPAPASDTAPVSAPVPAPPSAAPRTRQAVRNLGAASSALVLLSPSENETRASDALTFSWRAVPGTAFYELHIVTEEGNVVWSGKAAGTTTTLPDGHGLQAGTRYFVWVRAHLSSGGTVKSPAVPFRVSGQ